MDGGFTSNKSHSLSFLLVGGSHTIRCWLHHRIHSSAANRLLAHNSIYSMPSISILIDGWPTEAERVRAARRVKCHFQNAAHLWWVCAFRKIFWIKNGKLNRFVFDYGLWWLKAFVCCRHRYRFPSYSSSICPHFRRGTNATNTRTQKSNVNKFNGRKE